MSFVYFEGWCLHLTSRHVVWESEITDLFNRYPSILMEVIEFKNPTVWSSPSDLFMCCGSLQLSDIKAHFVPSLFWVSLQTWAFGTPSPSLSCNLPAYIYWPFCWFPVVLSGCEQITPSNSLNLRTAVTPSKVLLILISRPCVVFHHRNRLVPNILFHHN